MVDPCISFVRDVSTHAGWNLNDLEGAMTQVAKAQEQEWVTNNTITALRVLETGIWHFYFEQVP